MKKINLFVLILGLILTNAFSSFSQKPDEQLTREEAKQRIQEYQNIVNDLENQVKALDEEIARLQNELKNVKTRLNDCLEGYLGLLGINPETNQPFTKADFEQFKERLGRIENKVREMQRLSDDVLAERRAEVQELENSLNQLRMIKLAILLEFYDKIISLASDIRRLYKEPKVRKYTVGTWAENRDCLWNIAGKVEFFGDPFMWSKIWMANVDIIKNPDIIYPGQVLIIPTPSPKTPDEIKMERKYWRQKRLQQQEENKKAE